MEVKTAVIPRYFPHSRGILILLIWKQTSNVFVANLPPHVTEQSLGSFFARAGPVGSVSNSSHEWQRFPQLTYLYTS